jgi:hypothetical protein
VQNYLTEILLVLNLIGVLYLAIRISKHQDVPLKKDLNLEIFEKQKKVNRDMVELKATLEQTHTQILKELRQLRVENVELQKLVQTPVHTNPEHHLLLNNRYGEIFTLQKQGLSPEQIAKKVDKGTGEVLLIIELAKQSVKEGVYQ